MSETKKKRGRKRRPLEGRTLNGWEVLAYEGSRDNNSYYWCRCRCCGQIYLRPADKLLSGKTRRCKECAAYHIKYEGEMEKVTVANIPKKLRKAAYDKYGGKCAYCGEMIEYKEMVVDYLKPLQQGGKMEIDNLLPSCRVCKRNRKNRQLDKFRKQLQGIPKTLEGDSRYRLGKKYGIVQDDPEPMIQFFFETGKEIGKSINEDSVIKAMKIIVAYCKEHSCENCPMEVSCSHGLEPREWQIPISSD